MNEIEEIETELNKRCKAFGANWCASVGLKLPLLMIVVYNDVACGATITKTTNALGLIAYSSKAFVDLVWPDFLRNMQAIQCTL